MELIVYRNTFLLPHDVLVKPGLGREDLRVMGNHGMAGVVPFISQVAVPFIGRNVEMGQLSRALAGAELGQVQTVFITGEAGIGKTRLAQQFVTKAKSCGWNIWKSNADSVGDRVSFAMLLEVFQTAVSQLSPNEREALAREFPTIGTLLPGFRIRQPHIENDSRWDKIHAFEMFRSVAVHLTQQSPVIVWFDDFPESDGETMDWLHYFVRREPQVRMLFLATCRTPITNPVPEYRQLYTALSRHHQLREIKLKPFNSSETELLVKGIVSGEVEATVLQLLQDRTMGVPLFTVEMMRMLGENGGLVVREGKLDIQSGASQQIPSVITSVISERIGYLSKSEQEILNFIAISDVPLPWTILQRSTRTESELLARSLSRMVQLGILEETYASLEIEYTFSHPLIQEVVCDGTVKTTLQHLHSVLAVAWQGNLLRAAYHIRLAGSMADLTEAIRLLFDAGRHYLSKRSYRTATEYLETAVEMTETSPELVTDDVSREIKVLLCEAWANTERIAEAMELLNELYKDAPSAIWMIRIKRLMARIESTRFVANCIQHIEDGLQFWDGQSENEDVFWMLNEQVFNFLNSDDIANAERNMIVLRHYCDMYPSPKNTLVVALREAHMVLFDWRGAQRMALDAGALISRAQSLGDPEWIYDAYGLLGYSSLNQGDYASAIRYWKECVPFVRRYGMVTYEYALTIMGACGLFLAGDWEQALVELETVERMAREYSVDLALAGTLDFKAVIYALRGQWSKVRSCTKESEGVVSRSFPQGLYANLEHTMNASSALQTLMHGDDTSVCESTSVVWANVHGLPIFLKLLEGIMQIRSGHVRVTEELIAKLYQAAGDGVNYFKGVANLLEGLVAHYNEDTLRAMALVEDAVQTFDFLDVPLESAIARLECSRVAAIQQPERAEGYVQKAMNIFLQLGAKPFVERSKETFRMIQTHKGGTLNEVVLSSLSDREREIVSCIARGLSNKQIAEVLVLSPRTVDAHLHKIYQKLDVHSRTSLLNKVNLQ